MLTEALKEKALITVHKNILPGVIYYISVRMSCVYLSFSFSIEFQLDC